LVPLDVFGFVSAVKNPFAKNETSEYHTQTREISNPAKKYRVLTDYNSLKNKLLIKAL